MPIHRSYHLESVSDSTFAEIDEVVMKCAYATQNYFGRLFDERIYENDLARRLRAEGLDVHTQVPIKVTYDNFEKTYYLDMVVNQMLYEIKVVPNLLGEHDAQALNYAMLQNVRLVKLLNFGEAKVRGKLLRNAITEADRFQPTMQKTGWKPLGSYCEELINQLNLLIHEWGTHLDFRLYSNALVHYFGGELNCLRRIELISGRLKLGTHAIPHQDSQHGFVLTGFTCFEPSYRRHLEVLLKHSPSLQGIQWINLSHSRLEATTIERETDRRMVTGEW